MPLLTLIMPTKNRLSTATSTVTCLADLAGPDVEVVVQDASGDAQLGAWLARQSWGGKVSYAHDPTPGSMSDNWNRAIRRVTGDYICIVGDDDGVDARMVELARWAARNHVSSVAFPHSAYVWKDFPSKHAGKTMIGTFTGAIEMLSPDRELRTVLRSPIDPIHRLAQSYHGLVARALFLEMERRTGIVFDGLAPDYYTAVMLTALTGDSLAFVDYPFTMHGGSRASNSGRSRSGGLSKHIGEYASFALSDILPSDGKNRSLSTLFVAQSMMLALQRLDRPDLSTDFNLATVYGAVLATNPLGLKSMVQKLALASKRLGRSPSQDLRALPRATARAAFVLAKSVIIHALPEAVLRSRGFRLLPAADIVEALQRQAEVLRDVKPAFH
jgi:hypothetical protein